MVCYNQYFSLEYLRRGRIVGLVCSLGERITPQGVREFAISSDMAPCRMTGRIQISMVFHYLYILLLSNRQIYTGISDDLIRRVDEHHNGKVSSTKYKRPVKLIHYEAYLLKSDAVRREKYLKTTEGKHFLRQQIRDVLNK